MNHLLVKKIAHVKKNIDLQLEDIVFDRQAGVNFYYDTSDVIDAVLGARAFYPPFEMGLPKEKFNEKRTLVHSLMASGWFGKINMLAPHQSEFLTKLKFYFGVDITMDPKGEAQRFLRDVGLEHVNQLFDLPHEELQKEKLVEFFKQQAGRAEKLFKATQCVVPWHRRLARWEARKLLDAEPQRPRFDEILQSKDFTDLRAAFDSRREEYKANNFNDAIAVLMLVERLNDFANSQGSLPRFFVPTELFREVIEQAGVDVRLVYTSPLGGQSSVLCDADYFIYKAAFMQRSGGNDQLRSIESKEELLRDLSNKLAIVLNSQEKLTEEALTQIRDLAGRSLNEIIKDLQDFSFLENIWLEFEAPQDIDYAWREVIETSREVLRSAPYRQKVIQAIKVTEERFSERVGEFKWISSIWVRVEKAAVDLRARVHTHTSSSEEFFRDLGLFRYAFPEYTHDDIRDLLHELIAGQETEKDARITVITASYRGRRDPAGQTDRLIVAAAIMLTARMYKELDFLLKRIKPLPHRSLKVVFVEVLFKLKRKLDRSIELIAELEQEYQKAATASDRAELAMGIAYLFFRLWRSFGGDAPWRARLTATAYHPAKGSERYIRKAIEYAHDAYTLFDDEGLMKKAYVLNQYLYYMVEEGDEAHMKSMAEAAGALTTYRTDPEVWQYRFDDTLSRYWHFRAIRAKTQEEWERFLRDAERLSDAAVKTSHEDEDVQQHADQLLLTRANGFQEIGTTR